MKATRILNLIVAMAVLGITSAAYAADEKPGKDEKPLNYVVLKGGMYSPSTTFDLDYAVGANTTKRHLDSKVGFAGEVAMGHYFLPELAVELGAGYFQSKGSEATVGNAMLRVVPLIATAKVFLPMGVFEPYGLAGIGAYISDIEVNENSTVKQIKNSTEVTYGFHAGAGFNINFTSKMFAGLEGKYLWAEPSFGGQHVKLDGFITTANLGFRF